MFDDRFWSSALNERICLQIHEFSVRYVSKTERKRVREHRKPPSCVLFIYPPFSSAFHTASSHFSQLFQTVLLHVRGYCAVTNCIVLRLLKMSGNHLLALSNPIEKDFYLHIPSGDRSGRDASIRLPLRLFRYFNTRVFKLLRL